MSKPKKHYLDELTDELSLKLGQAVWAFARIEKLLFDYTKQLSKEDDLNDLLGYQPIKKRIEIIKKLINSTKNLNSEKQEALACLDKVFKLSKEGNQIAHNPWSIWVDLEDRALKTEIQDAQNKSQPINKQKITKFTKDAQELAPQLKNSLIPLAKAVRGF